jgi:hypothetical protein
MATFGVFEFLDGRDDEIEVVGPERVGVPGEEGDGEALAGLLGPYAGGEAVVNVAGGGAVLGVGRAKERGRGLFEAVRVADELDEDPEVDRLDAAIAEIRRDEGRGSGHGCSPSRASRANRSAR